MMLRRPLSTHRKQYTSTTAPSDIPEDYKLRQLHLISLRITNVSCIALLQQYKVHSFFWAWCKNVRYLLPILYVMGFIWQLYLWKTQLHTELSTHRCNPHTQVYIGNQDIQVEYLRILEWLGKVQTRTNARYPNLQVHRGKQ